MYFLNGNLHFNAMHVIIAFIILAALDCVLTYYALKSATGLQEVNPVMRFFMQRLGVVPALLILHYVPFMVAVLLVRSGNVNGWGFIVDGIFLFGLADAWDAYQLHKAGRL